MNKNQFDAKNGAVILNHCQGCTVTICQGDRLQGFESELLQIYRALDVKGKAALLGLALELKETAGHTETAASGAE